MKRHVQVEGIREWAADHLLELQSEPLKVLDRFFGQFGPYILEGCEVTPAADGDDLHDVAPGLVVLAGKDHSGADAVMVVPFAGATGVSLPLCLTLAWEERKRKYVTGGIKPIAYDYYAEASAVAPDEETPHLLLSEATPRFVDMLLPDRKQYMVESGSYPRFTAANALKLGGKSARCYLRTTGTAADSSKLGGVEAAEYVKRPELDGLDLTEVGEIRLFVVGQPFEDDDYLPCDGSILELEDYPDIGLPIRLAKGGGNSNSKVASSGDDTITASITMHDTYCTLRVRNAKYVSSSAYVSPNIPVSFDGNVLATPAFAKYVDGNWFVGVYTSLSSIDLYHSSSINGQEKWTKKASMVAQYRDIIKAGSYWLLLSSTSVMRSTNLTSWSSITPVGEYADHIDGRTIVVSASAAHRSDNITSWTPLSLSLDTGESLTGIAHSTDEWIITTNKGAIFVSTDNGITWEKQQTRFTRIDKILWTGRHWVVCANNTVARSVDDTTEDWFVAEDTISASGLFMMGIGKSFILGSTSISMGRHLPNITGDQNTKSYIRVKK